MHAHTHTHTYIHTHTHTHRYIHTYIHNTHRSDATGRCLLNRFYVVNDPFCVNTTVSTISLLTVALVVSSLLSGPTPIEWSQLIKLILFMDSVLNHKFETDQSFKKAWINARSHLVSSLTHSVTHLVIHSK